MEINKINDFNLETGYNYVVTIALLLHGCIISTDSINVHNLTFNNVTGDEFQETLFSTNEKNKLHEKMKNNFRKDQLIINNKDSYNVLPYDKIIGETSINDNSYLNCDIVNYIKKAIGLEMNGIFIISVHRKPSESINNNYQYLYPPNKYSIINIANLDGLKHLCDSFDENIYNNIYQKLLLDNGELGNTTKFDVELNTKKNHIKYIRLTYLLNLIKNIFGYYCHLNVYDYTCSIICKIPNNTGGKKRKTKKRKTIKKRKSKDHLLN